MLARIRVGSPENKVSGAGTRQCSNLIGKCVCRNKKLVLIIAVGC